jgi:hypothetical protein
MDSILEQLQDQVCPETKALLGSPLTTRELISAAKAMAKDKAPRPDGHAVEFYLKLWPTIGKDFTSMVQQSIACGRLPRGMNGGLIALLHKGRATDELINYRAITLLNISYKIVAKTLQLRLQPSLPDLINEDQTSFMPLRYILENVMVQSEAIQWAKKTNQDLILLKLDFKKAYLSCFVSWLRSAFLWNLSKWLIFYSKMLNARSA